jgi:inositol phosphorylceramide mannosyltransferase catalytic subunit
MTIRRRRAKIYTSVLVIIIVVFISHILIHAIQRRSPKKFINEFDLFRYANVTWPRRRVPRVIHQTYRTYAIPAVWNTTVQSVMKMNANDFKYHRWSHADMDTFVRQYEPHFYWSIFVRYPHDIQRIDSFRYILLFHVGGIYIDMDNACHRPFRELVATMEALDPDSTHLTLFPAAEVFGIQNNFMISTAGHPIYKQFISRLHLFNRNFLVYHVTVLLSAGPLYITIQEYFFKQTDKQVVRTFDHRIYSSMFWKTKGGTWFHRDTLMILHLYYNRHRVLWYCIVFSMWLAALLTMIILFRQQRRYCLTALTMIQPKSTSNTRRWD